MMFCCNRYLLAWDHAAKLSSLSISSGGAAWPHYRSAPGERSQMPRWRSLVHSPRRCASCVSGDELAVRYLCCL